MNKKVIIIVVFLGIVLSAGLYLYLSRNSSDKSLPAPVPVGYEKTNFSKELEPINEPLIEDVPLDETGFPDEQLILVQPENGSKIIVQIKNSFNTPFKFRIVHTPDGEWPDDPERTIEPNGVYPIFADSVGQYTLQNVEDPEQTFTITVERD